MTKAVRLAVYQEVRRKSIHAADIMLEKKILVTAHTRTETENIIWTRVAVEVYWKMQLKL